MISEQSIYITLLLIISADFILERVLTFLNNKSAKSAIPSELEGIYDEEKYAKSQEYNQESDRFGLWSASLSFSLFLRYILDGSALWTGG